MSGTKKQLSRALLLIVVSTVAVAGLAHPAYIEPGLMLRHRAEPVSVIVTGRDIADAQAAVRHAGGRITSRLAIVNAVAAVVDAGAIDALRTAPGVISVVENKKVGAASWNGWVTDLRILRGRFPLARASAPGATLAGGGFVAVSDSGEVLIGNPDGTERVRKTAGGMGFDTAPVAYGDDALLAGRDRVLRVSSDGRVAWTCTGISRAPATNVVVGSNGTGYVIDSGATLYAIDLATGALKFRAPFGTAKSGTVSGTPAIDAGNTVYFATDRGAVFAVSAAGTLKWQTSVGSNSERFPPILSGGLLYVAASGGRSIIALDPATGQKKSEFSAAGNVTIAPTAHTGGLLVAGDKVVHHVVGATAWMSANLGATITDAMAVSADGSRIYASVGGSTPQLVAINASTGAVVWKKPFESQVTNPSADRDGSIWVGENGGKLYHLSSAGTELERFDFGASITMLSPVSDYGELVMRVGTDNVAFSGRVPHAWNGRRDVTPASVRRDEYRLMNPTAIDVGADVLHRTLVGGSYVRGNNVGVAIVDSGVYWDQETKQLLGPKLAQQFIGQADFVEPRCRVNADGTPAGVQYGDHCFQSYRNSLDGYGHGTHVAGTIANGLIEEATKTYIGVAPDAQIVSVRVLGNDGSGSYESVIRGIQWVLDNKNLRGIRVMNLSLSAYATVPYFVDPLNRAVEKAWQAGIVVLAAAGNTGPFAQTITVPGNDPYVITVGAVNSGRTAGYWRDDVVAAWSATGPTFDGFPKPDVLAPGAQVVSYMNNSENAPLLVRVHPDYSETATLFRMNGTSMATAVASGVVALMLQVSPWLTPDQIKYRLTESARPSVSSSGELVHNTMQQGLGRIWAPDAVRGSFDPAGAANLDLDLASDLAHGYDTLADLQYHYQGPVRRMTSADGTAYLYYATAGNGDTYALGATTLGGRWLDANQASTMTWGVARMIWAGGLSFTGDAKSFASARMTWAGSRMAWGGARMTWAGARMIWAGGRMTWAGGLPWSGGEAWGSARMIWAGSSTAYGTARMTWAGSISRTAAGSTEQWVGDVWTAPPSRTVPPPAGTH